MSNPDFPKFGPGPNAPPPTRATTAWHHLLRAGFETVPKAINRSRTLRKRALRQLR